MPVAFSGSRLERRVIVGREEEADHAREKGWVVQSPMEGIVRKMC